MSDTWSEMDYSRYEEVKKMYRKVIEKREYIECACGHTWVNKKDEKDKEDWIHNKYFCPFCWRILNSFNFVKKQTKVYNCHKNITKEI